MNGPSFPSPSAITNSVENKVNDAIEAIGDKFDDATRIIEEKVNDAKEFAKKEAQKALLCPFILGLYRGALASGDLEGKNASIRDTIDKNGGKLPILDRPLFGMPSSGELQLSSLLAVVDQAELHCKYQSKPSLLHATCADASADVNGRLVATVDDHKPGTNIKDFGECQKTHKPCVPQTPAAWSPPIIDLPLAGKSALHDHARLMCTTGGSPCISIVDPGQDRLSVGDAEGLLLAAAIDDLDLDPSLKKKIKHDLVNSTSPTQKVLLWALFSKLQESGVPLENTLKGGHINLEDCGALYDLFKPNGAYKRDSSHDAQKDDIAIDLPGGGTILIAHDKHNPRITHIQMERHGARSHPIEHMVDWCRGQQLGPYGESSNTDEDPVHSTCSTCSTCKTASRK